MGKWGRYIGGEAGLGGEKPGASPPSGGAGYTVCPRCRRLTPIDTGYCRHCNAPLSQPTLLPPRSYKWDIALGLGEDGAPIGIRLRDLEGHLLVLGSVGTGKTTMVKQILYEASQRPGTSYTVIDWEGEYRDIGGATAARILCSCGDDCPGQPLRIDLLDPGPMHPIDYASWLTSVLVQTFVEEGWSVTPQMEALLRRAIVASIARRLPAAGLIEAIHAAARGLPQGHQTAMALETRLSRLLEGAASAVISSGDNTWWLTGTRTIVDLSCLARVSPLDARLVAKLLIGRVRHRARLGGGQRATHLLVIEEAEQIASRTGQRGLTLLAQAMMELRKRRVGVIIVAHSPSLLDPAASRLAANIAVFRLSNSEDLRIAASTLSPTDAETIASRIQGLRRGEFILLASSAGAPVLVKTLAPAIEVMEDARRLLASIYTLPYLTTRERRAYLGMSGTRYREAVQHLLARGLLRVVLVHQGRGRPVKLLQPRGMNPSVAHRYAAHHAARTLESMSCVRDVSPEPSDGADVAVTTTQGTRIAVEIETGTNINAAKYLGLLEKGYSAIVVVCTDTRCLRHARRAAEKIDAARIRVTMLAYLRRTVSKLLPNECGGDA